MVLNPTDQKPTPAPIEAAIGLGSNLGRRLKNLQFACEELARMTEMPLVRSSVYQTKAVDCPDPLPFLNAVVILHTRKPADVLLDELHLIENRLGRTRPYQNAPRNLDLDLIYYGETVRLSDAPRLPHPRMHQRLFVLGPLSEIRPDWVHPISNLSAAKLKQHILNSDETQRISLAESQWPGHVPNNLGF